MKNLLRKTFIGFYFFQLIIFPIYGENEKASLPQLSNISIDGDNVVIQLSQNMPYDVSSLDNPQRLVVEIPQTQYAAAFSRKDVNSPLIKRIRGYQYKENPLISRVIIDLKVPVDYTSNTNGNDITLSLKKNEVAAAKATETPAAPKEPVAKKSRSIDLLQSLPKEVVTLDFEGADIKDVIRLMAETSNINIIFGPEVLGNITIHLKKVPFDEAFKTILNLKGLVATQLGFNILRVSTPETLTQERSKAVMMTKTFPLNYIKAGDMQTHIQTIMQGAGRRGTLTISQERNSIVITDTEEGLDQAERIIAQLDKQPKQVMIEARIVEIDLSNGLDVGVQWEYFNTQNQGNGNFNFLGSGAIKSDQSASGSRLGWTETDPLGNKLNSGANTPSNQGTGVSLPSAFSTSAGITFGFVKNSQVLSATLQALVTQQRAQILSAPKVVTINGQKAKIEAVTQIPFGTSAVAANGQIQNSFQMVSAGITLEVTPTINAQDRVNLVIRPESSLPLSNGPGANPSIQTRNAQTTVIVKDADTLVIGGLIDDNEKKTINKVPLLGDIPIIGIFFRNNSTKKVRTELLIFVTPRIIRD